MPRVKVVGGFSHAGKKYEVGTEINVSASIFEKNKNVLVVANAESKNSDRKASAKQPMEDRES